MNIKIGKVLELINAGITATTLVVDAINARRIQVTDDSGQILTAAEVVAHIERAQAATLQAGDHAADRITQRTDGIAEDTED